MIGALLAAGRTGNVWFWGYGGAAKESMWVLDGCVF